MKSYTDIEQSKKLAKILPLESADMHYKVSRYGNESRIFIIPYSELGCYKDDEYHYCVCAWSLTALLKTLNFPSLTQNKEDEWEVCVFDHDNDDYIKKTASNPIDACCEMVMRLNELNLL
jgi:hypothetical protein